MRADPSLVSDLLFFRAAATTRSFVKASERLAVTQSAVSQRILRLEARLGVVLFHRHKSGLSLTGQGELLFRAVRSAFDTIDDALSAMKAADTNRPVTISCVPSLALEWLVPLLPEFYRMRPDISISVVAEVDTVIHGDTGAEAFDIAIRYGPTRPVFGNVVFAVPEQVFPVLSPESAAAIESDSSLPIVLLHDSLPWPHPQSQRAEWNAWVERFGMPLQNPTRDIFVNLAQLCYRAAMDGLGLAMGRKLVVRRHLQRGLLVPLKGAQTMEDLRYYVTTWPGQSRPETEIVLNWLTAQLGQDLLTSH